MPEFMDQLFDAMKQMQNGDAPMSGMTTEMTKAVRAVLRRDGWELLSQKNSHFKLGHRNGEIVVASSSPSCQFAVKNFMGDVRRAERK